MKFNIFLWSRLLVLFLPIYAVGQNTPYNHIDYILVEKSQRTMKVFYQNKLLKTYKIALGGNPTGPKTQEGDQKTPEGIYKISWKNPRSQYHLSLKISYPEVKDITQAKVRGVKPGGDIFIHGLPNGKAWIGSVHILHDWTLGCVAVTSSEIEEIYKATPMGTSIEIKP